MSGLASRQTGPSRIAAPMYRVQVGDLLDVGYEGDWVLQYGLLHAVFVNESRQRQKAWRCQVGGPLGHQ